MFAPPSFFCFLIRLLPLLLFVIRGWLSPFSSFDRSIKILERMAEGEARFEVEEKKKTQGPWARKFSSLFFLAFDCFPLLVLLLPSFLLPSSLAPSESPCPPTSNTMGIFDKLKKKDGAVRASLRGLRRGAKTRERWANR